MAETPDQPVLHTVLHDRHAALGARMVPFAGYAMPVQYPSGILTEHNWTRASAGLFDVSHMGQCFVIGPDWETTARALEALLPADILNLKPGQQRYSQFINGQGGILDDLMVTRLSDPGHESWAYLVVNAACKDADFALLKAHLPANVTLRIADMMALVALQGPQAMAVMERLVPGLADLPFMHYRNGVIDGATYHITRSGYTGEDGVEIAAKAADIAALWDRLLQDPAVKPIGLGARDSLRLEAGLCLYGHDIDTTTTPIEAGLLWSIQKRRRQEGGFPGAALIQKQIAEGVTRLRVGILPDGRAPAREGTRVLAMDGTQIGTITSGGFGPTHGGPVAMGYVAHRFAEPGTPLLLDVRGQHLPARTVPLPIVPHRYFR